jgi:hypothetical protein
VGTSGSDWYDCTNWLNGVRPGKSTQITIPATGNNNPTVSETIEVGGLTVEAGTTLVIEQNGNVIINE